MTGPARFKDADALAAALIDEVGPRIVLALPLGLGKANHIANALYARAAAEPALHLHIITALTLERPRAATDLERRFMDPISERLFAGYPALAYAEALRDGTLPDNVEISEFFLLAGRWLGVDPVQRAYISANYTHALQYVRDRGVNVVAQLVASRETGGETRYSLSSNTDLTLDFLAAPEAERRGVRLVGQVNSELPFMPGEADLPATAFSHVLESPDTDFPLFGPPKRPVSRAEHAIGLHVARLMPDGGTLQIGIGSIGDAVAHALIRRHADNAAFLDALERLPIAEESHTAPFSEGLYGLSEMFVDSFLDLIEAGVVKREVDGAVLDAAFFLGPRDFYRRLRELPDAERARLRMRGVSFTNELYRGEAAKRRARVKARFVNNAMMTTLLGAVVSDGLEDGQVVSGVGGQYNFVAQAFALDGARSLMTLTASRESKGRTVSNIRWTYGHVTVPRHLRDIVVTEYGIADLRGRTDRDCIAAMLAVADSRHQDELLDAAKDAGKIEHSYRIPEKQRGNTPERLAEQLGPAEAAGLLPAFPFGSDFTETERRLMPALETLKTASSSRRALARLVVRGLVAGPVSRDNRACLERMSLDRPSSLRERLYAAALTAALEV